MTRPCEITGQLQAKMWEATVREWVRRVGGDAAVLTFDNQGGVPEQKVATIADELVKACVESGNIPGMSVGCQIDMAAWACFARWYVYLDDSAQEVVRKRIRAGQKDPWNDPAGEVKLDDPTVRCGPQETASNMFCCPSNTFTDPYYTGVDATPTKSKSFFEKAAPVLLVLGGFGFGLFMIAAAGEPNPVGE